MRWREGKRSAAHRTGKSALLAQATAVLLGALLFGTVGCVERLLQVRSDPSGATVYVNGQEVGRTPLDHPFSFYGTVEVALRAQGCTSYREDVVLSPPWYEVFPFDLFSELLVPVTFRDVHAVEVRLTPTPAAMSVEGEQEIERKTQDLRSKLEREPVPASH
jgi:hypothetical protein